MSKKKEIKKLKKVNKKLRIWLLVWIILGGISVWVNMLLCLF